MPVITDVRALIRDTLATALGIPFVDGKLDGPASRGDFGCVFPDSKAKDADFDHDVMNILVRVFKSPGSNLSQRNPAKPFDPAVLETLSEQAELALDPVYNQSVAGFWYFLVLGIEFDLDNLGFEMSIQARATSLFNVG